MRNGYSLIFGLHVIRETEFFAFAFFTFPKWQEQSSLTDLYVFFSHAFEEFAFIFLALRLEAVCGERTE